MRQTAGTLNRTWLGVLGILLLLCGGAVLLQAGGLLQGWMNTASADEPMITTDPQRIFDQSWVHGTLLAVGLIVGLLGLLWMIAQIPRTNKVPAYRLHGANSDGYTLCDPSVLAGAVEEHVDTLPGVVSSAAMLRGTAQKPDLTLEVSLNDRADVQKVLGEIHSTVIAGLATSLEVPIQNTRVQIDITGSTQPGGTLRESTGTVLQ